MAGIGFAATSHPEVNASHSASRPSVADKNRHRLSTSMCFGSVVDSPFSESLTGNNNDTPPEKMGEVSLLRRGRDSNPGSQEPSSTVFETAPFNRSGTSPEIAILLIYNELLNTETIRFGKIKTKI